MLKPLRQKSDKARISASMTLPAPTAGWYIYDNLAAMPAGTAYLLENWFPGKDYIRLRGGHKTHMSGLSMSTTINSLMVYSSGSSDKMFAVADDGGLYDVSAGGTFGAALVSSLSNARMEATQFTTTGGQFLLAVNGSDDGLKYDGSSWAQPIGITGVAESALSGVFPYKNRLYFIQENSLSLWYLGVDSIAGAATETPLGSLFTLGGKLIAGATWSIDAGNGLDDVLVVVTSEGQVAVYTGSYPGDATSWSLKGLYKVGKPLGKRCLIKAGGDLAVLTQDGIVPLSKAITLDQSALSNEAVTKNIAPEYRRITSARLGAQDDWGMTSWPTENMFVVCVPKLTEQPAYQLVANILTGAWCRYKGWDAACFAVFQDRLYYGGKDGRVMRAETGGTDDATPYTGTVFFSFNDLKKSTMRKSVRLVRPNIQASFIPTPKVTIRKDYDYTIPSGPTSSGAPAAQARWDVARWDIDRWPAVVPIPYASWRTVSGFGSMLAPVYQITVNTTEDIDVRMTSMDIVFEQGSEIG
jgi:hypothetical protein